MSLGRASIWKAADSAAVMVLRRPPASAKTTRRAPAAPVASRAADQTAAL
jgi:hypothetical protein